MLATRVYSHEGSLECLRVGQGKPPHLGGVFLQEGVFRKGPGAI